MPSTGSEEADRRVFVADPNELLNLNPLLLIQRIIEPVISVGPRVSSSYEIRVLAGFLQNSDTVQRILRRVEIERSEVILRHVFFRELFLLDWHRTYRSLSTPKTLDKPHGWPLS